MRERPASPPSAALSSPLSRFPDCWLGLECSCGASAYFPVKLLVKRHGDMLVGDAVRRMRCEACGSRPAEAYLQETHHREHCSGAPPGWSVRLDKPEP